MKDILTSPRIEIMKRKARRKRVRLAVLFFLLFISIVWALSHLSSNRKVTINKITVNGTRIINISDIEYKVQDIISGKYLRLFSKRNIFIYPKDTIYKNLLAEFPRINKLSIDRKGFDAIDINIAERLGSYLYCGSSIPESQKDIGENCYFINDDGYIFDKAPYFSGNVYFKYYASIGDDISEPLGKQMEEKSRFHKLARFIDGAIALGFKPTHIFIQKDKSTLYLSHNDNDTIPEVIFNNEDDIDRVFDNLSSSMANKEFANEIRSKYSRLLYIDLRFDNKVVYKFQE